MIFYRYLFDIYNSLNNNKMHFILLLKKIFNNKMKCICFYSRKYSYLNNIIYLFYNIDIL